METPFHNFTLSCFVYTSLFQLIMATTLHLTTMVSSMRASRTSPTLYKSHGCVVGLHINACSGRIPTPLPTRPLDGQMVPSGQWTDNGSTRTVDSSSAIGIHDKACGALIPNEGWLELPCHHQHEEARVTMGTPILLLPAVRALLP